MYDDDGDIIYTNMSRVNVFTNYKGSISFFYIQNNINIGLKNLMLKFETIIDNF